MNETNCAECQKIQVRIETKLDHLNQSIMKIVYALLAGVGAQIGVKYMGTPFHLYIGVYAALFAGIFMVLLTIKYWKRLDKWMRIVRIVFAVVVFYASGLRIYFYNADLSIPMEYGVYQNFLYVALSLAFVIAGCKRVH